MLGKIKYSYIPRTKATDAILSSLAYAMKAADSIDYMLIDNKRAGRRIYPHSMAENVITCQKEDLLSEIEKLAEREIEVILVNGFDINLDEVREKFCQIVLDNDILLCINNVLDLENNDSNVSIFIEPDICELDDDNWEEIKEEIIENLEEAQLKNNKKSKNADLSSLLNLFGVNNLTKTNKDLDDVMDWLEDDTADLDVVEQYSYTVDNSELVISLNAENDIIINNEDDFIMIPKKQINFLIETLNKLTSNKIG